MSTTDIKEVVKEKYGAGRRPRSVRKRILLRSRVSAR